MIWPTKSGYGIKLIRMGCKNRPYFQIGATPSQRRTGLLPDEVIGSVDPIPNERNEIVVAVDLSRLAYWMGRGGRLSDGMQTLMGLAGWTPVPPHVYIEAKKQRDIINGEITSEQKTDQDDNEVKPKLDSVLPRRRPFKYSLKDIKY